MIFGIFTDSHYCPTKILGSRRPSISLRKIGEALAEFQARRVDAVLCLGDLTDRCESAEIAHRCLSEITEAVRASGLPFYLVPGNHDYKSFTGEELCAAAGRIPPYCIDTGRNRIIALDGCYRSDMRRYDVAGEEWTDANVPPQETDFLRRSLAESDRPCVVVIHQLLNPNPSVAEVRVKNAAEVRSILEESGKVSLVLQGHHHSGGEELCNGIRYLTLPAMCEGEENRYFVMEL